MNFEYITKYNYLPDLPEDIKILDSVKTDDGNLVITLNRVLSEQEKDDAEVKEYKSKKTYNIFEALNNDDIEKLSELDLTETELSHILSLFELISEDNKTKAFEIIMDLFKNKKLVSTTDNTNINESYTKVLLDNNRY